MPNKPEIKLKIGESVVGTLLNDTPYEGSNSNGKYYMYSLNVDVVEISHKRKDDGGSVYNAKLIGKEEKIKGSSSNTDLAIKWGMAFNNATRLVANISTDEGVADKVALIKDITPSMFEIACSMPTQPDEDPDSLPWD